MTLNEIIAAALTELGRGHDARSVESFRGKFTQYANDAICDIASCIPLIRRETQTVCGSTVDTFDLDRPCLKVLSVAKDGRPIDFQYQEASGLVCVRAKGAVEVTYRYMPRTLRNPSDIPEIPDYMHGLIVSYVAGRERMSGDTGSQHGSDMYLSMYEAEKQRLQLSRTVPFEIENKW